MSSNERPCDTDLEERLVRGLASVGVCVRSVWDLVNGPDDYRNAIPLLIDYLQTARDERFKEGVVRALAVRGGRAATPVLVAEFQCAEDDSYRWAIANTLAVVAQKACLQELIAIMSDDRHGTARQMIALALGRLGDKRSVPVLLAALTDDGVSGHAVEALGRICDDERTVEAIKPFLRDGMEWKRKAAAVAIKRIQKRREQRLGRE